MDGWNNSSKLRIVAIIGSIGCIRQLAVSRSGSLLCRAIWPIKIALSEGASHYSLGTPSAGSKSYNMEVSVLRNGMEQERVGAKCTANIISTARETINSFHIELATNKEQDLEGCSDMKQSDIANAS